MVSCCQYVGLDLFPVLLEVGDGVFNGHSINAGRPFVAFDLSPGLLHVGVTQHLFEAGSRLVLGLFRQRRARLRQARSVFGLPGQFRRCLQLALLLPLHVARVSGCLRSFAVRPFGEGALTYYGLC